jgi:hypothetical protein
VEEHYIQPPQETTPKPAQREESALSEKAEPYRYISWKDVDWESFKKKKTTGESTQKPEVTPPDEMSQKKETEEEVSRAEKSVEPDLTQLEEEKATSVTAEAEPERALADLRLQHRPPGKFE